MSTNKLLVILASMVVLAACQNVAQEMTKSGGVKMNKAEVTTYLHDRTMTWTSGGGVGYHTADGKYLFSSEKLGSGEGSWRVQADGNYCLQVEKFWGSTEKCHYTFYKKGKSVYLHNAEKGTMTRYTDKTSRPGKHI